MDFDWHKAIDRNCEALSDIAFRLLVMAGIQAGRTVSALPRHLYLRILAVLRPAEYAARRLIAMAACKLDLEVRPARPRSAKPEDGADDTQPSLSPRGEKEDRAAFALFDPFKRFGPPWLEPGEIAGDEDHDAWPALPPDEPVDAKSLCRRIRALAGALRDLDGQALRLARWRARRHLESRGRNAGGPCARAGRPAGESGRKRLSRKC